MSEDNWCSLSREDFEHALDEMGSVIDVTVSDLIVITDKARKHAQLRRAESLLVRTLMSHPVHTVTPDATLSTAAHLLLTHQISGLPVVDHSNHVAGIITEADLLCAIGLPCHRATQSLWQTLEGMFSHPIELREPSETVSALMVTDVITAHPEQSIEEALELMKQHRVKRLVVIDQQRVPIGMITRSNLVRIFFDRMRKAGASDAAG
ncbi:MAG TPA: CBS domain-containing protein [Gammaproteobacteria bacterium]|nr:CBS domain-containing protein [Gammaproteobacteria bacterium]HPQ26365.1 CBS domain-containing protein [Gammaproteobacteria bacterium]